MTVIAIDFDGTITYPSIWPDIGELRIDAKHYINKLVDEGHCIIIWSCRCDEHEELAKQFLCKNGIRFMHFNQNCNKRIEQYKNDTRKIGADIYIDDKSVYAIKYGIQWDEIYKMIQNIYHDHRNAQGISVIQHE